MAGTLVIRADAGPTIGIGHVMRCLALAKAWRAAGGRVVLVGHCPLESVRRKIRAAELAFEPMERPYPHPSDIPATQASVARAARESESLEPLWLAIDGYHFDPAYQEAVRPADGRLLLLDDTGQWPEYHVDLLLNQNLGAERTEYAGEEHTNYLLGPRYALLRPEFLVHESWRRPPAGSEGRPTRILVTLGGSDPQQAMTLAAEALRQLDLPDWEARVVVAAAPPPSRPVRPARPAAPSKIQQLFDVPNMSEQMRWADVALSAAGGTCWEMAYMQLPAVVMTLAENQRSVAEPLAAAGVVVNLGPAEGLDPPRIAGELAALVRDLPKRTAMAQAGRRLIDGRGAQRVVAVMDALDEPLPEKDVKLRPATADDLLPLWRLANDPVIRRYSLSPEAIPLDRHTCWFEDKLKSADAAIWVFDFHGLILGTARYERSDDETALASLSVAPAFRRRGLGTKLLRQTLRPACERLAVKRLRALVRRENVPSARIFHKVGFEQVESAGIEDRACQVFEREV